MTYEQFKRHDLEIVARTIPQCSRVLDLGCGDGSFLRRLKEEKGIDDLGVEIEQDLVSRCIDNGVNVIQRDLDAKLDFADEGSFDVVVLSQTLQQVKRPDELLCEIVRVGRRAVVSAINFGHLPCRWKLLFTGRMPETETIPYHWYDTPNIHLGTICDFRKLCRKLGIAVVAEIPVGTRFGFLARLFPNMLAPGCVFILEKRHRKNRR